MTVPWMLDELAHAGPEHLDPAFVAAYDRKQGYPDPMEDLDILSAGGRTTVIDIGAGTGRFALAAASRFERVVAVDVSPAMLDVIRGRAAEARLTNLEVVKAGFLSYRHTGPPADAVHTRNALHQLPDFWKVLALQRVADLLRSGGLLRMRDLIYDFEPADASNVLDRWLASAAMLAAAGFEIVDAEFRGRIYGAYTCVRR